MSYTSNPPVLTLRKRRSVSPPTPLKLPMPENCQSRPTAPMEAGVADRIVGDIVDLQAAGVGVAQEQVAGAAAGKIAHARELPIQADGAHEVGAGELIVGDVVDLDPAGAGVAQDHVGFAAAREIAEAHDLPIDADGAEKRAIRDVIVADVVDLEAACTGITQKHVGRIASLEAARAGELPLGPHLRQRMGGSRCCRGYRSHTGRRRGAATCWRWWRQAQADTGCRKVPAYRCRWRRCCRGWCRSSPPARTP